jgi:Sulfotransferase domain
VTVTNAWWGGANAGDEPQRRAVVSCDGCLPPRVMVGYMASELRAAGWEFEDLEAGQHLCRWCTHRRRRVPHRRVPPQDRPGLPNLLIVGAGKSGTMSMHRYLAAHPQIYMSEVKEPNFFQDPSCLDALDTYATLFDGRSPVRGEASPSYSVHPLAPGVPERVSAAIPGTKLIYLVRDPVERAVSHYVQRRALGLPPVSLGEAFGDLADPYNPYIAPSRYATQLGRYLDVFSPDQVHVIDQADLLSRRRETLRAVFRFLDVDDGYWSPEFDRVHGARGRKAQWTWTGTRLAESRLAGAIRRLPHGPRRAVLGPARRVMTRKIESPVVDEDLHRRLRDACRAEVERLRELTGKPFASWQI